MNRLFSLVAFGLLPVVAYAQVVPPAMSAPSTGLPPAKPAPVSNLLPPMPAPHPLMVPSAVMYLNASQTFISRASTATYFDNTGTLQTAAINTPRYDYDPITHAAKGLLVEPQRTNFVRNGNLTGAVIGNTQSGGNLPTNWSIRTGSLATAYGLTVAVVGMGTENGLSYVDLRVSGTPSATPSASAGYYFSGVKTVHARVGQVWTSSAYYKLVAGSLTNIGAINMTTTGRDVDGNYVSQSVCSLAGVTGTLSRASCTHTLTDSATRYAAMSGFGIGITAGMPIDITLRIAGVQLELGDTATSYIPTIGTFATRAYDVYQQF